MPAKLVATSVVQLHTVTDPESGLPVTMEIRKIEGGPLIGLDEAFLSGLDGDPRDVAPVNPYELSGAERLLIPDDECTESEGGLDFTPHWVFTNSGDGVDAGVEHFSDRRAAQRRVVELMVEQLHTIFADDDDGVPYRIRLARLLHDGKLDEALSLLHSVPDQPVSINYGPVLLNTVKLGQIRVDELLADHLAE